MTRQTIKRTAVGGPSLLRSVRRRERRGTASGRLLLNTVGRRSWRRRRPSPIELHRCESRPCGGWRRRRSLLLLLEGSRRRGRRRNLAVHVHIMGGLRLLLLEPRGRRPRRSRAIQLARRARCRVRRWMNICRHRRHWRGSSVLLQVLQQRQPRFDRLVVWVQVECSPIRVDGIGDLVVARLIKRAEVIPDLRDVWVESDRSRVGVKGVSELVDLVVEDADRAPERRVSTVPVDGLLIRLVRLVVPLTRHERPAQEVPALGVGTVWRGRISFSVFFKVIIFTHLTRDSWSDAGSPAPDWRRAPPADGRAIRAAGGLWSGLGSPEGRVRTPPWRGRTERKAVSKMALPAHGVRSRRTSFCCSWT